MGRGPGFRPGSPREGGRGGKGRSVEEARTRSHETILEKKKKERK